MKITTIKLNNLFIGLGIAALTTILAGQAWGVTLAAETLTASTQVATISGCGGVLANADGTCSTHVADLHGSGGVLAED